MIANGGRRVNEPPHFVIGQPARQRREGVAHLLVRRTRGDQKTAERKPVMGNHLIAALVRWKQRDKTAFLIKKQRRILKPVCVIVHVAALQHEMSVARSAHEMIPRLLPARLVADDLSRGAGHAFFYLRKNAFFSTAGTPATITCGGTSFSTTAPPAT
jgi:hypothetical protein